MEVFVLAFKSPNAGKEDAAAFGRIYSIFELFEVGTQLGVRNVIPEIKQCHIDLAQEDRCKLPGFLGICCFQVAGKKAVGDFTAAAWSRSISARESWMDRLGSRDEVRSS